MTRKQALRKCAETWEAIAKVSLLTLEDDPNEVKKEAGHPTCPACRYNLLHKRDYCFSRCIVPWSDYNCCAPGSEFARWKQAIRKRQYADAAYWAEQIAAIAREELHRLNSI